MKITTPLILKFLDKAKDGKWFELYEEFEFYIDWTKTHRQTFTVPKSFKTDFASIPKVFRVILSTVGKHGKAAVLHDYLCEYGYLSRKKADLVLLEAMRVLGVGYIKRTIMYRAVRIYSIVSRAKAGYKNV
ncbi:hypothetical protein LCGC14_2919420 [marine sediment metagenome]|uniref:DUF1353 domain-containing protein n=1 Tax=marine sediment metagenome TaxID=412755 RepID=A0A0F8YB63_9ZZZZ